MGTLLERERLERIKKTCAVPRHSRFGGQFSVKLTAPGGGAGVSGGGSGSSTATATANDNDHDDDNDRDVLLNGQSNKPTSIMIRRPFDNDNDSNIPQAKLKRAKKNLTFAQEDPYVEIAGGDNKEILGQRACVVAATLADRICVGMGLKQLILRVNEDLRRDEHIVGNEQELTYFQVLTTLLRYNRMKLLYEKTLHDRQTANNQMQQYSQDDPTLLVSQSLDGYDEAPLGVNNTTLGAGTGGGGGVGGWVPPLQNMIDALDKMTFARVLFTMEKLHTKDKRYSDEHIPIALFKEMICYVRILLESSNSDHNDIAVATLYRLFYTTSERQGIPLP